MRYVVRNNFFGLGAPPQKKKTKENKPVPTTTPGPDGRQLLEEDGANFQSGSVVESSKSLVDATQEAITKSERAAAEQINQEMLKHDQVYPVKAWDSVDSSVSVEQAKMLNAVETLVKVYHDPDLSSTDKVTLNIYDDEVWETPDALV